MSLGNIIDESCAHSDRATLKLARAHYRCGATSRAVALECGARAGVPVDEWTKSTIRPPSPLSEPRRSCEHLRECKPLASFVQVPRHPRQQAYKGRLLWCPSPPGNLTGAQRADSLLDPPAHRPHYAYTPRGVDDHALSNPPGVVRSCLACSVAPDARQTARVARRRILAPFSGPRALLPIIHRCPHGARELHEPRGALQPHRAKPPARGNVPYLELPAPRRV
jgi:hypothetical protein